MIKKDEYGTYGMVYKCPSCNKEHGDVFHHITTQLPILCDDCLINDKTDINLRINTLIYYVMGLRASAENLSRVTSCLRVIH